MLQRAGRTMLIAHHHGIVAKAHPEYEWQRELAGDLPSGAWTLFATTTSPATGAKGKNHSPMYTQVEGPYDVKNPLRRVPENPTPPLPSEKRPPLPGTTPRPPL